MEIDIWVDRFLVLFKCYGRLKYCKGSGLDILSVLEQASVLDKKIQEGKLG